MQYTGYFSTEVAAMFYFDVNSSCSVLNTNISYATGSYHYIPDFSNYISKTMTSLTTIKFPISAFSPKDK